jgi:hypothetical protein
MLKSRVLVVALFCAVVLVVLSLVLSDRQQSATAKRLAGPGSEPVHPGSEKSAPRGSSERRLVSGPVESAAIYVANQEGDAIEGAAIRRRAFRGESPILLGYTTPGGRLGIGSVASFAEWPIELSVTSVGHAEETVLVESAEVFPLHVTLRRLRYIRGLVLDPVGNPVMTGPVVVAFPEGHAPSSLPFNSATREDALDGLLVQADELGRFRIGPVLPGLAYQLAAAGGGYATRGPVDPALPGEKEVVLMLEPLYGAIMRLTHEGRAIGAPDRELLWTPPGIQWSWRGEEIRGLNGNSIESALLGLPSAFSSFTSRAEHLLVFTCNSDDDVIGPFVLRGQPAGYSPVDLELFVPRMRQGLTALDIGLQRTEVELGAVLLEWDLSESVLVSSEPHRSGWELLVNIASTDGRHFFEAKVDRLRQGMVTFGNVPHGSYDVLFSTPQGYLNWVGINDPFTVGQGTEPLRVTRNLSSLRCVRVGLHLSSGETYSGEAVFEVRRSIDGTDLTEFFHFKGAPFVIEGLIPMEYQITLDRPHWPQEASVVVIAEDRAAAIPSVVFRETDR